MPASTENSAVLPRRGEVRCAAGRARRGALDRRCLAPLALLALAAAAPARAAAPVETRSNAPIDITADEAEVINSKCVAIWRGAAEALQGDARLRANTISVFSVVKPAATAGGQTSCGSTDRIEAEGNVFYVTPERRARADHAVYSSSADQIVLRGNVIVVQGEDVARGDRLTIRISTKEARLESVGAPAAPGAAPRRVRGVFYPARSDTPSAKSDAAGAAAPPSAAAPASPPPP